MTQAISPLRQRMIDDMRMRKFSPKTEDAYIRAVQRFTAFLGRSPDTASDEDLRRYQLHLVVYLADLAQRDHHWTEVLLRVHGWRPRTNSQDDPSAGAAQAAGDTEPRGGRAADPIGREPEVSGGAIGGLRRRI